MAGLVRLATHEAPFGHTSCRVLGEVVSVEMASTVCGMGRPA
jgi:hypothetical protein